jgi:hypothetical protein
MEQYIGEKKVRTVVGPLEEKTPIGNDMIKVIYVDNSEEIMPATRFELLKTEERSDATTVQNKLRSRVAAVIYSNLHEFGVKMGEVNGISDAVFDLVNNGYERARTVKFGFDHMDLPLIEINKILLNATVKSDDGVTSTGSESNSLHKE